VSFEQCIRSNEIAAHTIFYINGSLANGISLTRNEKLDHRRNKMTLRVTFDLRKLKANSKIIPVHSNNKYGEIVHEERVRQAVDLKLQGIERARLLSDPMVKQSMVNGKVFNLSQTNAFRGRVEIETLKELKTNKFVPDSCHLSKLSSTKQPWCEEFHLDSIKLSRTRFGIVTGAQSYIKKIEMDAGSKGSEIKIKSWCADNSINFGWLK